jgi:hypothetical protein
MPRFLKPDPIKGLKGGRRGFLLLFVVLNKASVLLRIKLLINHSLSLSLFFIVLYCSICMKNYKNIYDVADFFLHVLTKNIRTGIVSEGDIDGILVSLRGPHQMTPAEVMTTLNILSCLTCIC